MKTDRFCGLARAVLGGGGKTGGGHKGGALQREAAAVASAGLATYLIFHCGEEQGPGIWTPQYEILAIVQGQLKASLVFSTN